MPVRVQMLTGRSVTAGGGGNVIVPLVLGVLVLAVLAVVLLPLALILGGVGLVALGIYKVNRWLQGIGSGNRRAGMSSAMDASDFDALRERLQDRARAASAADHERESQASQVVDADGEGRRNVRVIGNRQ